MGFSSVFLMFFTPWMSMSRTQIWFWACTACTAPLLGTQHTERGQRAFLGVGCPHPAVEEPHRALLCPAVAGGDRACSALGKEFLQVSLLWVEQGTAVCCWRGWQSHAGRCGNGSCWMGGMSVNSCLGRASPLEESPLLTAGGWNLMTSKVPSNPNHPGIL